MLHIQKIPFEQIPQFSKRDVAYYNELPELRPFFKYSVQLETFRQVIDDKARETTNRAALVEVLKEQYQKFTDHEKVQTNIEKLTQPYTFTVITAHQPSLFTGPLYYILKIISTINLAKTLNATYPDSHVVPVFVTGGEDHDFEEVNHLHLFGKTLTWESGESGSVGQMNAATLKPVLEELKTILGDSDTANHIYKLLEKAHTNHEKYSDATIEMVHELFKEEGLLVANLGHPILKRLFIPIIKEEIFEQRSHALVNETIEQLNEVGFGAQASPRDINFFYLRDQVRARIVEESGRFQVLNTNYQFTRETMEEEIENHPERFSPNVVMRPLFQELVMPNLAYIGGGGELAYWLERKTQFAHFGINFPMLIRRNSAMWIDKGNVKRMQKLGLTITDLWQDVEMLIKKWVEQNAEEELSLKSEKVALQQIFEQVAEKTKAIDRTLVKTVWAEHARQLKSLEQLEGKLMRAEKQKHDVAINQVRGLKDKLFPGNNGLQERKDNFLNFYLKYGATFFDTLKECLHPLEKGFVVVSEK